MSVLNGTLEFKKLEKTGPSATAEKLVSAVVSPAKAGSGQQKEMS
jgi:hypothetical protein